jgi:RND family efflux transporter MFP subunit
MVMAAPSFAGAVEVEGFTQPYRKIEVAAAEDGVITSLEVREGDTVRAGQVVARLDEQLLPPTLKIATQLSEARGQLQASAAEARLKAHRLRIIEQLRATGQVTEEELVTAEAERDIAEANLRASRENVQVRELERIRVEAQLARRLVRAPIDGVVADIRRDCGESVTTLEPVVMTVVQLDALLAVFSVPLPLPQGLTKGQEVSLRLQGGVTASGQVETVSPVTNPQSGTVRVKVRVPNPDGSHRSGLKCTLLLP